MRRIAWVYVLGLVGCGADATTAREADSDSDSDSVSDSVSDSDSDSDSDSVSDSVSDSDSVSVSDSVSDSDSDSVSDSTSDTGETTQPPTKRPYPDSSAAIRILADQFPGALTEAQRRFAVDHFVGTQKLTTDQIAPLRALAPDFLVLHYHLAIWQSAPNVPFIIDGATWGNDFDFVTTHESWFWHNAAGQRVAAIDDGKFVMNLADPEFASYWQSSMLAQVAAGDYDGVFADSASPDLLNWEAQNPPEPRFDGTGVRDTPIAEWGGQTYCQVWETWIAALDAGMAAEGVPLIPNTGAFITSWDRTDFTRTQGAFIEGFAGTDFLPADWEHSTDQLLALTNAGKIVILQNYLENANDVATRLFYLANYLLVRGPKTYLEYFAADPFEWYPEWGLDLGAATMIAARVDDLRTDDGLFRRDFERGFVLVNPSDDPITTTLASAAQRVTPTGGGPIPADGTRPGSLATTSVTSVTVAPHGAAIFTQ